MVHIPYNSSRIVYMTPNFRVHLVHKVDTEAQELKAGGGLASGESVWRDYTLNPKP